MLKLAIQDFNQQTHYCWYMSFCFFGFLGFYWSIVGLQCCVSFKWVSFKSEFSSILCTIKNLKNLHTYSAG